MKKKLLSVLLLSTALLSSGCGDDDETVEENIDNEGCEHLQEGPAVAVTATAPNGTVPPPAVSNNHRRYDISLVEEGVGGKTGSVSFAVSEATDYVIFLGADVPLTVTNANGQTVAFEESVKGSSVCGDIKARYVLPLTVGTHLLNFGPTSETKVSIVLEEGGDHDHEG